ncbi:MAG: methyltransferase domain-containing protein [Rhodospirillaceae bacterium]|nr:methyltransferase domain-containing protein [Rhodospirillaceae bacterium]
MPMLNRRKLLGATTAAGSMLLSNAKAYAKLTGDVELRGQIGRLERLPTRDLESMEDFSTSLRDFVQTDLSRAAARRANAIFKDKGISSIKGISLVDTIKLLENDPIIMSRTHAWIDGQLLMWSHLQDAFHNDADRYLTEMAAADKSGPGSLELNPDMYIPPYTAHEIHNQPGGYVGDAFAGHMYHYGTNNLYIHRNEQDEQHISTVSFVPVPDDGKIKRILDLGCSVGQTATALKERFPGAEVWGIDVGAPMVRYAHMRAADIGIDVNFAQRLAEENGFPDNHFDIITANILFHEVSPDATTKIIRESHRALRPGGVFFPNEPVFQVPKPPDTIWSRYFTWWNTNWNTEVWYVYYSDFDYANAFQNAGFVVRKDSPSPYPRRTHMVAVKKT